MPIIPITSISDLQLAPYQELRERDLIGRGNRFIAEGKVVIDVLLQSSYSVESLLLSEKQIDFLDRIPSSIRQDVPIYLAPQTVMDAVVGFPIHRGLLAIGRKASLPDPQSLLERSTGPILGLIGIANHDNIGGIFRNAAAFGCSAILLDDTCCDPLYRKALRVSVGGVLKVPFARVSDAATMTSLFKTLGFDILALSPKGAEPLSSAAFSSRTALLLGAEGPGLPDEILSVARTISIPMATGFDSLNVATTSGIALYALTSSLPDRS